MGYRNAFVVMHSVAQGPDQLKFLRLRGFESEMVSLFFVFKSFDDV